MKPRIKLAEAKTLEGGTLALYHHDDSYAISFNNQELMHSKMNASEKLLGERGVEKLDPEKPARILIGGLGLGFTLQSVLTHAGPNTAIEVVELMPEVIQWNRQHLTSLNGKALDDPRVEISAEDIAPLIRNASPQTYDVILLDVDNGPLAMVAETNASLYSHFGVRHIKEALVEQGRVVFWSASPDPKFEKLLRKAGFKVESLPAKTHASAKRFSYILYIADKRPKPAMPEKTAAAEKEAAPKPPATNPAP